MYALLWSLLGLLVGELILPAVFHVFFLDHVERKRKQLAEKRSGKLRQDYVDTFVWAVRGHGRYRAWTAIGIVFLTFLIFAITFLVVTTMFVRRISNANEMMTEIGNQRREMQRIFEQYSADASLTRDEIQGYVGMIQRKLLREEENLRSDLMGNYIGSALGTILSLLLIAMVIAQFRRFQRFAFLDRFSYELERFTLRMQGLASKGELAELVKKEAAVKDEQTAKEFVDVMAKIAKRHGVESLVDTFLLWGPPSDVAIPGGVTVKQHRKA